MYLIITLVLHYRKNVNVPKMYLTITLDVALQEEW